jgi:hypothetical protein
MIIISPIRSALGNLYCWFAEGLDPPASYVRTISCSRLGYACGQKMEQRGFLERW